MFVFAVQIKLMVLNLMLFLGIFVLHLFDSELQVMCVCFIMLVIRCFHHSKSYITQPPLPMFPQKTNDI